MKISFKSIGKSQTVKNVPTVAVPTTHFHLHNKILVLKHLQSKWTRKQSPNLNEITNMSHSNGVCSRIETVIGSERLLVGDIFIFSKDHADLAQNFLCFRI